ncbi:MAG: ABC transporter substrate-binding protein, partial [Microthrixaceae bacterium]
LAGANALDAGFIEIAGDAASDVYISAINVPPFLADENPATQEYLDLYEEYLPDGKSEAGLGYNSFSAWLLFAAAVKECGSEVTRACVFDAASSITEWSGGGLHAPTNPAAAEQPSCVLVVEATPDGFVIPDDFEPDDGLFQCSDENVVALDGDYGEGVTLESLGLSVDDLE